MEKEYENGDFHDDDVVTIDGPASAQVESCTFVFPSMLVDTGRVCNINEAETIDYEISRWMKYAHKMRLNQHVNDDILFWKTNTMSSRWKQMAWLYLPVTSTSFLSE